MNMRTRPWLEHDYWMTGNGNPCVVHASRSRVERESVAGDDAHEIFVQPFLRLVRHLGMTHRTSRRRRGLVATALGTGVLITGVATAAPASAATPTVTCTSSKAALATKLKKDITAALANRKGTVAVGLYDRTTNTTCTLRASTAYDSASVVKVTVLGALLWDAQKTNRALTSREKTLATAMITKSDNASTSTLWKQLGMTKIKGFLTAAKMTQTKPGANNYWGLTQITVTDEQKLLKLITAKNTVLTDASRTYIRTDGQGRLHPALGHPLRPPRRRLLARQERLALPRHPRLARPQRRHLQEHRPRLHDHGPHPRQQHDGLRHHDDPDGLEDHPQGPGGVLNCERGMKSPPRRVGAFR